VLEASTSNGNDPGLCFTLEVVGGTPTTTLLSPMRVLELQQRFPVWSRQNRKNNRSIRAVHNRAASFFFAPFWVSTTISQP